jgi:hypothetical protein
MQITAMMWKQQDVASGMIKSKKDLQSKLASLKWSNCRCFLYGAVTFWSSYCAFVDGQNTFKKTFTIDHSMLEYLVHALKNVPSTTPSPKGHVDLALRLPKDPYLYISTNLINLLTSINISTMHTYRKLWLCIVFSIHCKMYYDNYFNLMDIKLSWNNASNMPYAHALWCMIKKLIYMDVWIYSIHYYVHAHVKSQTLLTMGVMQKLHINVNLITSSPLLDSWLTHQLS